MFSTKEFQAWGKEKAVLFAAVMTRIEGRAEDDLLRTYGFNGFPSLALLDAKGEVITKKLDRDLHSMSTVVSAASKFAELKAKVEAGERVDAGAWLAARLGVGEIELADAKKERAALELPPAAAESIDQQIHVMEVTALLRSRDSEKATKLYDLYKAGRRLPDGTSMATAHDSVLLEGAKHAGDATVFLAISPAVKQEYEKQLTGMREALAKFKNNAKAVEQITANIKSVEKKIAELDEAAAGFAKKK